MQITDLNVSTRQLKAFVALAELQFLHLRAGALADGFVAAPRFFENHIQLMQLLRPQVQP